MPTIETLADIEPIAVRCADIERGEGVDRALNYLLDLTLSPNFVHHLIFQLLKRGAPHSAKFIVQNALDAKFSHPLIDVLAALIGCQLGMTEWLRRAERAWAADRPRCMAAIAPHITMLEQLAYAPIEAAYNSRDHDRMDHLLRFLSLLIDEPLAEIFAARGSTGRSFLEVGRRAPVLGRLGDRKTPPGPRTMILVFRKYWSGAPGVSRLSELAPRIERSMLNVGWTVHNILVEDMQSTEEWRRITQTIAGILRQTKVDGIIIDDLGVLKLGLEDGIFDDLVDTCRQVSPTTRIVAFYPDIWERLTWSHIRRFSARIDRAWVGSQLVNFPEADDYRQKRMVVPVPFGGVYDRLGPFDPAAFTPSFIGSVHFVNFYRAFWLNRVRRERLNFAIQVASHMSDGLEGMDSYRHFMERMRQSGIAVNFSLRADGSRVPTGRAFETLVSGALLVQEECADLEWYMTPGEHYLSFRTFGEFLDICDFAAQDREGALRVARRGQAFALEHLNDRALIAALEADIFDDAYHEAQVAQLDILTG